MHQRQADQHPAVRWPDDEEHPREDEGTQGVPVAHAHREGDDKLPKGWIANVAYTLVGDDFATWIMNQVDARNLKIAQDRNLMINLDPEIAAAFAASTSVARKLFL